MKVSFATHVDMDLACTHRYDKQNKTLKTKLAQQEDELAKLKGAAKGAGSTGGGSAGVGVFGI